MTPKDLEALIGRIAEVHVPVRDAVVAAAVTYLERDGKPPTDRAVRELVRKWMLRGVGSESVHQLAFQNLRSKGKIG